MNERIKQLAEQAGFDIEVEDIFNYKPQHSFIGSDENMKKFAELIVRECAQICFSESKGHNMAFGEHCGIVIKEHFGVE
jgi:hypothetical protein